MQLEVPFPVILWICTLSTVYVLIFYVARLFGHNFSIGSIRPTSLHRLKYRRGKLYSISVNSIKIKLHLPRSLDPHWAKIFIGKYEYEDDRCAVYVQEIIVTLWFFPVLYGFTTGPLVNLFLDEFRVEVYHSSRTPEWIAQLRDNLIYTVVNEETVRAHDFNNRLTFSPITGSKEGYEGALEKPGLGKGEEYSELKIRGKARQWHIYNSRNHRMYTFNVLDSEIRKCWAEDRGKLVMIAQNSLWTKLPVVESQRLPTLRHLKRCLIQAPGDFKRIIYDPLVTVNMEVSRCDITFDDFRIRDSAFDEQVITLFKRHYGDSRSQGLLSEGSLDLLIKAIASVCT